MNNQCFDEAQTKEFAKFWTSEIGEIYLQRLENSKQLLLVDIMNNADKEILSNIAGRAAGIELVIQDIKAGIDAAKDKTKEAKAKGK